VSSDVTGCTCGEEIHWWPTRHANAWTVQHGDNLEHRRDFGPAEFYTERAPDRDSRPVPEVLSRPTDWKAIREWLAELHERLTV
jgi:hypothetical protein